MRATTAPSAIPSATRPAPRREPRGRPTPRTKCSHHGTNTAIASQRWGTYHSWNTIDVTTTTTAARRGPTTGRHSSQPAVGTRNATASVPIFSICHGAMPSRAESRPRTQKYSGG